MSDTSRRRTANVPTSRPATPAAPVLPNSQRREGRPLVLRRKAALVAAVTLYVLWTAFMIYLAIYG